MIASDDFLAGSVAYLPLFRGKLLSFTEFTLDAAVVAGDLTVEGSELGSAEVLGGGIGAVAVTFPFLKLKSGILYTQWSPPLPELPEDDPEDPLDEVVLAQDELDNEPVLIFDL